MPIGQAERQTQQRVIQLFRNTLGYQYLGHWQDRPNNRNIETELLEAFLTEQGHSAALIQRHHSWGGDHDHFNRAARGPADPAGSGE